mmetsp:Transcript_19388/g.67508  ORF Transcript_19388/g.67508 Transcript_19388/m.67508 type:complete len:195 (-) Transcript_19388:34-618(-)
MFRITCGFPIKSCTKIWMTLLESVVQLAEACCKSCSAVVGLSSLFKESATSLSIMRTALSPGVVFHGVRSTKVNKATKKQKKNATRPKMEVDVSINSAPSSKAAAVGMPWTTDDTAHIRAKHLVAGAQDKSIELRLAELLVTWPALERGRNMGDDEVNLDAGLLIPVVIVCGRGRDFGARHRRRSGGARFGLVS